jgi:hypothetical protein
LYFLFTCACVFPIVIRLLQWILCFNEFSQKIYIWFQGWVKVPPSGAWHAISIDFITTAVITSIKTQGALNQEAWVTTFKVNYFYRDSMLSYQNYKVFHNFNCWIQTWWIQSFRFICNHPNYVHILCDISGVQKWTIRARIGYW